MRPARIASACCTLSCASTVYTSPCRYTVSAAPAGTVAPAGAVAPDAAPAAGPAPGAPPAAIAVISAAIVPIIAAAAGAGTFLDGIERRSQVRNEVAGIFDADRYADQGIGDADTVPRLLGDARMRGAGRMRHQSLGASQAHRELDHLQGVEQAKRLRLAALDRKSECRAGALALPPEHRVSRVVRTQEAQVIDARDLRVAAQKTRHQGGVLRRLVHAQRQRLHRAHDHPGGVGVELRAERAAQFLHRAYRFARSDDAAG